MNGQSIDYDLREYFPFGFAISQAAWETHEIDGIAAEGDPADIHTVRCLAEAMNAQRDFSQPGVYPVSAGQLLAAGLLMEVLRYVAEWYCQEEQPRAMLRALHTASQRWGVPTVDTVSDAFLGLFPPRAVREGRTPLPVLRDQVRQESDTRHAMGREALLLRLMTANPAMAPLHDLFDDRALCADAPFVAAMTTVESFLDGQPPLPETGLSLIETLHMPARMCPDSLEGQLAYVLEMWTRLLPTSLVGRLTLARDVIREETQMRGLGPGPSEVMRFQLGAGAENEYPEPERFSRDADWMPNVVMIAKVIYVWLDQLSKRYERTICRLDQIPDKELDRLARWNFSGLWLIGIWERSPASQRIKQIMGNPEAVASAYSLYDYDIAADLGGEEAYRNLSERAARRGIRLASDMVPNHMGLYSRWVVEHPGWFIQSSYPPFPAYNFTGPDLSSDERVHLYIEDGYWDHCDAAVVFRRVDSATGDVRYIYHGNDGTSMPWNDTAQLDFLNPEVREAVIQTILHVARKFPIIRFDAAMTLAKKHYQRLWFPKPGDAGAIPSRAEHGMSRQQFDEAIPVEFWREVVDRVAQEAPDTLLLAEAFWLMEGYFVRTLGMHRVYNSSFMNMLKMEENFDYRSTLKNVLEFSPPVLQRFVNFMNNPDELTAVEQFGSGDKYLGVAMLMVTMPGLPMFGHGQIEGYKEKYGMEYRRAYWDEPIDYDLVRRHEDQIFPIMDRRWLFQRGRTLRALRPRLSRWRRQRERLRLLQPQGRRPRPHFVQQRLRFGFRYHPHLYRYQRWFRRRTLLGAPLPGRSPGTPRRSLHFLYPPRAPLRPGVPAQRTRPGAIRANHPPRRIRVPGLPGLRGSTRRRRHLERGGSRVGR
jgi:glycosidase